MKRRASNNMATKDMDSRLKFNNDNGIITRTTRFFNRGPETSRLRIRLDSNSDDSDNDVQPLLRRTSADREGEDEHKDSLNYALLIALYTLQGIPMGLSASIPFLIQQKVKLAVTAAAAATTTAAPSAASVAASAVAASRLSYNANAIFALCSWPFSLKLLWAPIVDACFIRGIGRRKSWLIPVQGLAGLLMVFGAKFVERQLGLGVGHTIGESINVKGVTAYFFVLYFLMATQDIAVDGWALTMLSKKNRGRGPVCNSIGQNLGYFLSFVGFLALNDVESSETLWRPLLGMKSMPDQGLVSLGSFIQFMGYFMLFTTTAVALFKREAGTDNGKFYSADKCIDIPSGESKAVRTRGGTLLTSRSKDEDMELDASEIGLRETYHRLLAVCKLPAVRWLFLILLTYRLPTALSDNVKFLKAVEFGLSKSTTALLSPTVVLPLGILVPIVATKLWHNHPLKQFMHAYKLRVTLVPIIDVLMLLALRRGKPPSVSGKIVFWGLIILSTALQAIVSSLQFNAQMTFFAKRVDPAIGGSYMTLLNTAANLGGTWPASMVMWLVSRLSSDPQCSFDIASGKEKCVPGRDPFFLLQCILSILGCLWILVLGKKVKFISELPDDAWRTHILDEAKDPEKNDLESVDVELGDVHRTKHHLLSKDSKGD